MEKKATKLEMQSNAKHKFECFKTQGVGKMTNGMQIKIDLITCQKMNGMNMESSRKQRQFDTH
jgi:hypothetical protein